MAISNSGMTLYTNNDNEAGWNGTDGADAYNNAIQGVNSESWQVSKNNSETGTLTKSANMGTSKYFTFFMSSNLAPYYTSLKLNIRTNTSNYEQWTLATSANRKVSGDFHPIVAQFGQGTTIGTLNKTSIGSIQLILDNTSSGNIRSVINNWIDTMHYGNGRTMGGSTANNKLFLESHTADTTTNDEYDGCSELYKGSLAFQTDITINTTTGNSYGEVVNFAGGYDTDNTYTITVTGTTDWQGTTILGVDSATVKLDATSATSFGMSGGGITNGGAILFASGQTISGTVFDSCANIVPDGATINNTTISNTTETTAGALKLLNSSDLSNLSGLSFSGFSGKYALYIPASITGTITLNNFKSDGSGTDVYWAGTSGTLTINKSNGTNFSTSATGGGTVNIVSSVSININVKDESGASVSGAYVYIDEDLQVVGSIANTTTDASGNVSTSYSGGATTATVRVRKYGFKPNVGTISLTADSSTNIILIADPQQN